jgi:alpha-beta hydrolase superfamily lysophospholipase
MPHTVPRENATFVDAEGVTIHHHRWEAPTPRAVVQLVHGVGEYAARYEQLAQTLAAAGYSVDALDWRGHGQTGLAQWGGDHAKIGRLGPGGVRATIAGIRQHAGLARRDGLPLVLLGHSMGSLFGQKIIDADASDYAAVVFSGTASRTPRQMNAGDLNKRHAHLGPTTAEWLTRDRAIVDAFARDPLTTEAKVAQLFGIADGLRLYGTPRRVNRDLPLLLQVGEEDPLGGPRSVELLANAYRRAGLTDITIEIYPGARHEVYNETNRVEVLADLVAWLDGHVGADRAV